MQSNERQALIESIQKKKPAEPCNLQNATTQLQRYYMVHPVSMDGWKAFKSNIHRLDARKWRM